MFHQFKRILSSLAASYASMSKRFQTFPSKTHLPPKFFVILASTILFLTLENPAAVSQDMFMEPGVEEWSLFAHHVNSLSGVKLYSVLFCAVQFLFLLFRTIAGEVLGIYRLLVLAILSVAVTIGTNLVMGKSLIESALLDGGTLMAYQVLFYQIQKQWGKRNSDRERIVRNKSVGVNDRGLLFQIIKRIKRRFS